MKKKIGEPVRADRSYTTLQLCEATNLTPLVIRAAVRAGLQYIKTGRGRQFLGEDWLAWLRSKRITAPSLQGRTNNGTDTGPTGAVERVLEESVA